MTCNRMKLQAVKRVRYKWPCSTSYGVCVCMCVCMCVCVCVIRVCGIVCVVCVCACVCMSVECVCGMCVCGVWYVYYLCDRLLSMFYTPLYVKDGMTCNWREGRREGGIEGDPNLGGGARLLNAFYGVACGDDVHLLRENFHGKIKAIN